MKRKYESSLLFRSGIATVDQAILSVVNFCVSIILIKNVPKVEYGYYGIVFPLILLLIAVQNAIINTPLAILLVTKKGKAKLSYVSSLCYGQFIFLIPLIIFVLISIGILRFFGMDSILAGIAAAFCITAVGSLYREFLRSYFFAEEKPLKVLKLDIFYVVLYLSLILLTLFIFYLKTSFVFFFMGISSILVSVLYSHSRKWKYNRESIKKSYYENWKFGKWALLGVIVTHIQTYCYIYFIGALIGSASVADVSAARILLMPLVLIQAGWSKTIIPHGSKLREQNNIIGFYRKQIIVSLVVSFCVIIYTFLLIIFSNTLLIVFLSEKYTSSFDYIIYFGISFILGSFRLNAANGLMVMKKFAVLTKLNILSMLVTLGCTYILIQKFGIKGGLVAAIIGEFLLAVFLWFYFTRLAVIKSGEKPVRNN